MLDTIRRWLGATRRERELQTLADSLQDECDRWYSRVTANGAAHKAALTALREQLVQVIHQRNAARVVQDDLADRLKAAEAERDAAIAERDTAQDDARARVVLAGRKIAALTEEVEKHRAAAAAVLTFTVEREEFEARMARARESARILRQVEAALERPMVELSHVVCVLAAIQPQVPGHESVLGTTTTATGGAA